MSDSGDKPRAGGPLPRTNRPRPDPAQRRTTREKENAAIKAETETAPSEAGSISVRVTRRSTETNSGDEAAPPTAPTPDRDGDAALEPDVLVDDGMMAERPTQLDTGRSLPAGTPERRVLTDGASRLKRVPLLRADGTAVVVAEDSVPTNTYVGCVIDGRYRIEGVLGRGGMGVVYRARHEVIDKLFAVKILLPTEDTEVVERFVNEARAATAIGNAHIVDTVDFGALPDGSTYFVMEYLEGQTLARWIKTEGFIPVSRSIAVSKQIAEGMSAAHWAGIVHRDLKPENIFLTRRDGLEDFVKLLDFGIAKIESSQNRITRAGTIFGTPHYMSPEQASGAEVDARTDVYALGVILYEMLSGRVPFEAENPMGLLTQHLYTEPTALGLLPSPPQTIPSSIDAVVLKCLAKKPDDRYASMSDFAADLDRVSRGEPPDALGEFLARAERNHDETLLAAARAELERSLPRRRKHGLAVGMTLAAVAASTLLFGALRERRGAPRADARGTAAAAPSSSVSLPERGHTVALVFSPIDAEVFREGRSLGGMPVTVRLGSREKASVEIRREGFYPERVLLDGSLPVVVVRLTPIPGVQPRVPVPVGEPLETLRRARDAGALRAFAAMLYDHHDAGAPLTHQRSHGDAGAPRALPVPALSAPSPAPAHVEPAVVPAPSSLFRGPPLMTPIGVGPLVPTPPTPQVRNADPILVPSAVP